MQIVNLDVFKWSFITIRHPLDRLFSEFRAHPIPGYKSFMEWVEFSSSKIASNASFRDNHFRPQVDFMHDGIEIVKTDTHLTRDWAKSISRKHNLNFTQFSVKKKRNTGIKKSFYPTSEELNMAIEFFSKYYKSDFEAFGYKMDDADIIRNSLP